MNGYSEVADSLLEVAPKEQVVPVAVENGLAVVAPVNHMHGQF